MNIPFFQQLQALKGPALHKVVAHGSGPERDAAERILQHVLAGLPEMVAAAVVDTATGQAVASYVTTREFHLSKIAGYNAEVVRQHQLAHAAMQLPAAEHWEEILITLRTQLHLLRQLRGGRQFLYVVVACRDTNLGIAREVMRTCQA